MLSKYIVWWGKKRSYLDARAWVPGYLDICLRRWQLEKLQGLSLETMLGQPFWAEETTQTEKNSHEGIAAGSQNGLRKEGPRAWLVINYHLDSWNRVAFEQKQPDVAFWNGRWGTKGQLSVSQLNRAHCGDGRRREKSVLCDVCM